MGKGRCGWESDHVPEWKLNKLIETYGYGNKAMMLALLELKQRRADERYNAAKAGENGPNA